MPRVAESRSKVLMKVNAELLVKLRKERSCSQDELAIASGLNLRTIQRVEKYATASPQTKKALAAALQIDTRGLDNEELRKVMRSAHRVAGLIRRKLGARGLNIT
jgi:transcriptional regulator with XRE-family HTH domain